MPARSHVAVCVPIWMFADRQILYQRRSALTPNSPPSALRLFPTLGAGSRTRTGGPIEGPPFRTQFSVLGSPRGHPVLGSLFFVLCSFLQLRHRWDDLAPEGLERRKIVGVGHIEDNMLEAQPGQLAALRDDAGGCVVAREVDRVERGALDRIVRAARPPRSGRAGYRVSGAARRRPCARTGYRRRHTAPPSAGSSARRRRRS